MAQTFKDRLKLLIQDEKPYAWARKVGIEKGLFQYYWQKEKIPTYLNLIKIQNYTGCSLDWLLTGKIVQFGKISDLPLVKETKAVNDRLNLQRIKALEEVNKIYLARNTSDIKVLELFLDKIKVSASTKGDKSEK
ncbi:MAG: hypothetical protein OEY50_02810 [Nitrospinota bacterium]|nr:hypothetical protein [Nitrospinota bacterium]MDH5755531.1 hypothetical protein [Nitrospinota bacterium]